MEKIDTVQQLKLTFLDMWKDISDEDTELLLKYEGLQNIQNRYKEASTDAFPVEKIVLIFHAYASIAYLSAELIVNAKIFLDTNRQKYILLARKQTSDTFEFCIVYSNVKELSSRPGVGLPIDNIIGYLESDNSLEELIHFYTHTTK